MHGLADLTAFHDQRGLHTLTYRNQVMMYSAYSQQRGNEERPTPLPLPMREGSRQLSIINLICQNNIVISFIYCLFCILT